MFYLHTFGGLGLEDSGRPITGAGAQRSRLVLLAVLASAGERGISRDTLLALLWPDKDTESARGALKQASYALRRDLGEAELTSGVTTLKLNQRAIGSDVGRFQEALAKGDFECAAGLYRGGFLDGVHLQSGEFEQWLSRQRSHLAERHRGALEALARSAEGQADYTGAVRWWKELASADPLSASVARSLMQALVRVGDSPAALRHAQAYEQIVRAELDVGPDPALIELIDRIRRDATQPVKLQHATPVADFPAPRLPAGGVPVLADSQTRPGGIRPEVRFRRRRLWLGAGAVLGLAGGVSLVSGVFTVLAPNQVALTVRGLSPAADSALLSQLAAQLIRWDETLDVVQGKTRRTRYQATVASSIVEDSLRLVAELVDAEASGQVSTIAVTAAQSSGTEALHTLSERLSLRIAAQQDSVFSSWSWASAMPTNWPAYRALRAGIDAWSRSSPGTPLDQVLAQLDTAATLDPQSATPLIWKALLLSRTDALAASDSILSRLSPEQMGPWDRSVAEVLQRWNQGDLAGGHDAGHRLLKVVPNSEWAIFAAWDAEGLGRHREALDLLNRVPLVNGWAQTWGREIRFQAFHLSGRFAEELEIANEGLRREPDSRWYRQITVRALAGLGRIEEVERRCAESLALAPNRGMEWQPCGQAYVELWGHGNVARARALAGKVIQAVVEVGDSSESAALDRAEAWLEVGDWEAAAHELVDVPAPTRVRARYLMSLMTIQAARHDRVGVQTTRRQLASLPDRGFGTQRNPPFFDASIAALLGDKDAAVALIAKSFRGGFRFRTALHQTPEFESLHGHAPYETFLKPIDDPLHRTQVGLR